MAEAYDSGRRGYPGHLIEDAVRLSGITPGGRILEIGCGTGQATLPFAKRGYRIECVEPGPNLARLARRNLASWPNAKVVVERFEDWRLEPASFDLVLAATSLHHVEPGVRYAKSAAALRPGGALAVLADHPGEEEPGFREELDAIYARWYGAESNRQFREWTLERRIKATSDEIDASGLFGPVEISIRPWTVEFDIPRYMALLESDSMRIQSSPESHEGLKRSIAEAVTRRGGRVRRGFVAVLSLARRAS